MIRLRMQARVVRWCGSNTSRTGLARAEGPVGVAEAAEAVGGARARAEGDARASGAAGVARVAGDPRAAGAAAEATGDGDDSANF